MEKNEEKKLILFFFYEVWFEDWVLLFVSFNDKEDGCECVSTLCFVSNFILASTKAI